MEPVNPTAPPIDLPPLSQPVPLPPINDNPSPADPVAPPPPPSPLPTETPIPPPPPPLSSVDKTTEKPIVEAPNPTVNPAPSGNGFVFKPEKAPSRSGNLKKVVAPLGLTVLFLLSIPLVRNILPRRRQLNAPAQTINCDNPRYCSGSASDDYYEEISRCRTYFNCSFEGSTCTCSYYECLKKRLKPSPALNPSITPTIIPWPNIENCSWCQTNRAQTGDTTAESCLARQNMCSNETGDNACALDYVPGCASGSSCRSIGSNPPPPVQPPASESSPCGCTTVRAYDSSNNEIGLSQLPAGQTVKLTVGGTGLYQWKARLKVHTGNGANLIPPGLCSSGQLIDGWCETAEYLHKPDNKGGYFINYSVPENPASYQVTAEICCAEVDKAPHCNWME